ncbi:MAG TPA: DUF5110 domain-containing protein, partial [Caulobacteraceae bacterium]
LDLYLGPDCHGSLYLDDGHSLEFRRGHFLRQQIRCSRDGSGALRVEFLPREGDFHPWWRSISLTVHGWSGGATARQGGRDVPVERDHATLRVTLPDMPGGVVDIVPAPEATP